MEALKSGATAEPPEDGFAPIVRRLALVFAISVAVMLPGGYFSLKYSNLVERVETMAGVKAAAVNALAVATPELWMFQEHRLEDMLRNTETQFGIRATVRDAAGNSILAVGDLPQAPSIVHSHAIYDSGRLIGYVDIALSYREVVIGTLFAGSLGVLLGAMVYGALLVLPLRALRRIAASLAREQQALHGSEERYHLLFNLNPVPLWVFDEASLAFLAVNDAAVVKYGWSREEFLAMTLADIRRAEDVPVLMEQLKDGREERVRIVSQHCRKDGSLLDVEIRSHRIEFAGRNARIASAYDVTERNRAEAEIRKSAAFRELLLEAIPLPVFYKDAACRYSGCNSAFTKFIGKRRDEVIGKTVFDVAPAGLAQTYRDRDLDLLEGAIDSQVYESQVMHADGSRHDVIFHKARMTDDAGRPTGIIGGIADVTAIKHMAAARDQLESQLRESQKMEALGTLAGGIAHDFNNIIAMITGNAVLAREDLGRTHPAAESLEEILKASSRAKALVNQILAFGRRQAMERKAISLEPAVMESTRLLRATLPAGVSLNVECAADAPAALADKTQIEQLLINLCTNAWQAMRARGSGGIEVRLQAYDRTPAAAGTPPGGLPAGRYVCLSVNDDGPGMDETTRARIFEPFFTTKPMGEGTGLGLSVVHGIVQQHSAHIEVESAIGTGTSFRIYFPAVDVAVAAAEPARGARADSGRHAGDKGAKPVTAGEIRQILYIDDDDALVYLLTRLLDRRGYHVSGYTDAREALAAARARPDYFDLAVTDYNMPGMSGLDVARALREIRPGFPVAITTGYITEELRAAAPSAGVSELIYKPDSVEALCDAVARLSQSSEGKSRDPKISD